MCFVLSIPTLYSFVVLAINLILRAVLCEVMNGWASHLSHFFQNCPSFMGLKDLCHSFLQNSVWDVKYPHFCQVIKILHF